MNDSTPPVPDQVVETNQDAKNLAMLAHLLALAGVFVVGAGFILGPLIVWLMKKDQYPFVDDQGKEAVNFQITMLIAAAICMALIFTVILAIVAIPALIVLGILDIVLVIIAGMKARDGIRYRYPFAIRLIK